MSDHPDLFEPLRRSDHVPGAPAPEVRRRGDRLRRRRHAAQVIGAGCAVALLATGGVLLGGSDVLTGSEPPVATQDSSPDATPRPPADRIPESFELTAGWESGGKVQGPSDSVSGISGVVFCDAAPSPADLAVDHQGAVRTGPGLTLARDLAVYADTAVASQQAQQLVGFFEGCPRFSLDDGASFTNTSVESVAGVGDEAWVVRRTYESGGEPQVGQEVLVVVRAGTAVLVEREYSDGPGATDEAALDLAVDGTVTGVDQLVRTQLCVFTDGGC